MTEMTSPLPATSAPAEKGKLYQRFSLSHRIEHAVLLTSFSLLGFTGLPQKYIDSPISQAILSALGGIEGTRKVHHVAAFVLLVISAYHILALLYRLFVLRARPNMMPVMEDLRHLIQDVAYYLGLREKKAQYGRYNYAEKAEYLAVVWGTVIMAITGFMMWNPISTARVLPGEFIPAAKVAHGSEAVLAVLAIILWHFYHVHIRHFNKSMFTGKFTREEMEHEHPAELHELENGQADPKIMPAALRRRQRIYFPVAAVMTVTFGFGLIRFVTMESTAQPIIKTGETVAIYVPVTPTPRPVATPTVTPQPGQIDPSIALNSWKGSIEGLFRNRCGTCHGRTKVSGLTLETYQDALKGGKTGPAIVPGDPDNSEVVIVQTKGKHPGQLSAAELQKVVDWIKAGAPEK